VAHDLRNLKRSFAIFFCGSTPRNIAHGYVSCENMTYTIARSSVGSSATTSSKYVEHRTISFEKMRGTHDANHDSHAPDRDNTKFLKVAQIDAIRQGVHIAPKQPAKQLRHKLHHCSPNSRINPKRMASIRGKD
jgi:hypothetical protein